jgi:hypothetical protein
MCLNMDAIIGVSLGVTQSVRCKSIMHPSNLYRREKIHSPFAYFISNHTIQMDMKKEYLYRSDRKGMSGTFLPV